MFEDLFAQYYHQVTHGCESVDCQNPNCASCSKFTMPEDPTLLAVNLAENHFNKNCLCPSLSYLTTDPCILLPLAQAQSFFNQFIFEQKPDDKSLDGIAYVLSNYKAFPYLFLSDDLELEPDDLLIDESSVNSFLKVLDKHKNYFDSYRNKFTPVILKLIEDKTESLRKIRAHIILFLFPDLISEYMPEITQSICKFSPKMLNIFVETLIRLPSLFRHMVNFTKIALDILCDDNIKPHSPELHALTSFTEILSYINSQTQSQLPQSRFFNEKLCTIISPEMEFRLIKDGEFSYLSTPSVLTHMFRANLISKEREYMNVLNNNRKRNIIIRRDHILEDSLNVLLKLQSHELHEIILIQFNGEKAQDDGGVFKEFLYLLTNELMKPDLDLFKPTNTGMWFSHGKNENLYKLFGIVVGLAITNEIILPVRFPKIFYKKLARQDVTINDYEQFEPEIVQSFKMLKNIAKNGGSVKDADMYFTAVDNGKEINLKENGSDILVDETNYNEFINLYIDYFVNKSINKEFEAFFTGYSLVCDIPIVSLLSGRDLELCVSGEETYNWLDLEQASVCTGYNKDSQTVKDMWKIFQAMDVEKKKAFLRFVTGSDRSPMGGLKKVIINIQRSGDTSLLPTAHTCKSILVLPDYQNAEKLEKAMTVCVENAEGLYLI